MRQNAFSARIRALIGLVTAFVMITAVFAPFKAFAVDKPYAVDGTAAILVDAKSGTVLYEQNADGPILPASTTKIMTALLVVEAVERGEISLEDSVPVKKNVIDGVMSDASRMYPALTDGELVPVGDLLRMALMESDCLACDILADYLCGSVAGFVSQMNARAAELGCGGTTFVNSHGYPQEGHITTARSLYLITAEAIKHPVFAEVFGCLKYAMPATNKNDARTLYSTNKLLYDPANITSTFTKYYNEYVTGGKTGYSTASGNCLASVAEKGDTRLVCVITGVKMKYPDEQTVIDAFTETSRLLNWGFANYSTYTAVKAGQALRSAKVTDGQLEDVDAVASDDLCVTLENGETFDLYSLDVSLDEKSVEAPVSAGDVLGRISVTRDGSTVASAELLAAADVLRAEKRSTPNVVLLVILMLMVAGAAAGAVWYTNNNKVLLLDLTKEKLGGTAQPRSRAPRPSQAAEETRQAEVTSPTGPEPPENPFDEFFRRAARSETVSPDTQDTISPMRK